MQSSVSGLTKAISSDPQWQAFVETDAIVEDVTFGVQSLGSDDAILATVGPGGKSNITTGKGSKAAFLLVAKPEQWEKFFDKDPQAPYTSFVGLQVSGPQVSHPFFHLYRMHTFNLCHESCLSPQFPSFD